MMLPEEEKSALRMPPAIIVVLNVRALVFKQPSRSKMRACNEDYRIVTLDLHQGTSKHFKIE
jgi:hypothetical protein